jgi:uncharacterized protein (TIGR03435 family)
VTPQTSPEPSVDDRPTIWDAIKEQLGLQLEAIKSVPVEVLVLDKANREPKRKLTRRQRPPIPPVVALVP